MIHFLLEAYGVIKLFKIVVIEKRFNPLKRKIRKCVIIKSESNRLIVMIKVIKHNEKTGYLVEYVEEERVKIGF